MTSEPANAGGSQINPEVAPGWHEDPYGRHELRYFDGATWLPDVEDEGAVSFDPMHVPPPPHHEDASRGVEQPHPATNGTHARSQLHAEPEVAASTQQLPVTEPATPTATSNEDPPPGDSGSPMPRRVWWVGGGVVMALALLAGAIIGYNTFAQHQQHDELVSAAYSSADSSLRPMVDQLAHVKTTADVRNIAAPAQSAADAFAASLPPMEPAETQRANSERAALTAVGSLTALNADTLANWPTTRQSLQTALANVQNENGVAGVPGSASALTALDTLVAGAMAKLKAWEAKNDAKVKANGAELSELGQYATKMRSNITAYEALRNDTSADLDALFNAGPYYDSSTAYANFQKARDARMAVRSEMQQLSPPSTIGGAHASVLAATSHGIAGMSSLLAALDQNRMCANSYYCGLNIQSAWSDFQTTSNQVTAEYDRATDGWQAKVENSQQRIKDRGLPPKPAV